MSEPPVGSVPSPCIGACHLDRVRDRCSGCARSLAEIAGWRTMDDAERLAVWARLGRAPSRSVPAGDRPR